MPTGFRQPVKEFAWLALRTPATVPKAQARLDPATLRAEVGHLRRFTIWLTEVGVTNFGQVTQAHLDDFVLRRRQEVRSGTLRCLVRALQRCAAYSATFSEPVQRFGTVPWKGRPANVVAGERHRGENTTLRVPEDVMAPVLRVALLYVEQFADDIAAAQREARALATKDEARSVPGDEQLRLADQEIGRRRSTGLLGRRRRTARVDGPAARPIRPVWPTIPLAGMGRELVVALERLGLDLGFGHGVRRVGRVEPVRQGTGLTWF